VISDSFQVIEDGASGSGNYYQASPFLTYLTNNPDIITGLGWSLFPPVWTKYKRASNETPLHVLERLAAPTRIQTVVGRYWARMAYVDIGHKRMQAAFQKTRKSSNYANLDSQGSQPRYMGASIIPLKGTRAITASMTVAGNALFIGTLAISGSGGVRYLDVKNYTVETIVGSREGAALVIANTSSALVL